MRFIWGSYGHDRARADDGRMWREFRPSASLLLPATVSAWVALGPLGHIYAFDGPVTGYTMTFLTENETQATDDGV